MQMKQGIRTLLFIWLFSSALLPIAQAADLNTIASQVNSGKNLRSNIRKLNSLLTKVLTLQVKALAQSQKPHQALKTYEILVSLKGKEVLPLLDDVAWSFMLKLLKSKNTKAHEIAADFLGDLGDKKAVQPLIKLLRSKGMLAKMKTAIALGKLGDKKAIRPLRRTLRDRNYLVSTTAAWALAKLGDKKGLDYLEKCYKRKGRRYRAQRFRCAQFLGKLKKRHVLSYLNHQLKVNSNRRARKQIAEALSTLRRNRRWINSMKKDLRSRNEMTRLIALQTLGELKARRARRAIRKLLKDRSIHVRIAAAKTLGQLRSKRGTKILLKALQSKNSTVRTDAAEALIDVKSYAAKKALIKALSDSHLIVRVHAGFALARLRSQIGTGAIREGLERGNAPLQMLAAKYAIQTARKNRRIRGKILERKKGQLNPATVTKAFLEDTADAEPDSDIEPEPGDIPEKTAETPTKKTTPKTTKKKKKDKKKKTKIRRIRQAPDVFDDDW